MTDTLHETRSSRRHESAAATPQSRTKAGRQFKASKQLSGSLQQVLVDLVELGLQGKQAHWNVVGHNFRDTHLLLDEIVAAAHEFTDTVAERLRALDALPDGRSQTVSVSTTLPQYPAGEVSTKDTVDLVTERLDAVAATARDVHDRVDEEDPTSADILHEILERIEQLSWLLRSENRTPQK